MQQDVFLRLIITTDDYGRKLKLRMGSQMRELMAHQDSRPWLPKQVLDFGTTAPAPSWYYLTVPGPQKPPDPFTF